MMTHITIGTAAFDDGLCIITEQDTDTIDDPKQFEPDHVLAIEYPWMREGEINHVPKVLLPPLENNTDACCGEIGHGYCDDCPTAGRSKRCLL